MKFIKYTAILGAVLTVLGFGTAQAAKMNGGYWDRKDIIRNQPIVAVPPVTRSVPGLHHSSHHSQRWESQVIEDGYAEWLDDNTLLLPVPSELSLELRRGNVTVSTAETEEIRIVCDSLKTKSDEMQFYQEDDELKMRIGRADRPASDVTILLPQGYQFHEAEFEIAAGSCKVLELLADEMSLHVSAGELVIQNGEACKVDLTCAAGALSYTGQILEAAEVECAAGSVHLTLYQKKEDFNYEAEGTGGNIQIGDTALSGILFEKSLNYNACREMELQCAGGQIQVEFLPDQNNV